MRRSTRSLRPLTSRLHRRRRPPGDTVAFTAGASGVGDLSYSWDLDGDGSFGEEGETGAQVSHVFLAPGAHVVRLVVTDSSGRSTRVEHSVSVRTPRPRAELLALPAAPRVGQEVTFVSLSRAPYGSIATEEWDLDGDGPSTTATALRSPGLLAGPVATRSRSG